LLSAYVALVFSSSSSLGGLVMPSGFGTVPTDVQPLSSRLSVGSIVRFYRRRHVSSNPRTFRPGLSPTIPALPVGGDQTGQAELRGRAGVKQGEPIKRSTSSAARSTLSFTTVTSNSLSAASSSSAWARR